MDKLCGPDSLPVVCHRFSDGVDVVKCVSGFLKEVGDVEQSYSNSLEKLVRSHLYNFHSNFLKQLIGSDPYEEIGTIRHTWSELGSQLTILAQLHAEKAQAYIDDVRKPLLDLTPILEDTRKELKNKARVLKLELETAANRHNKEKFKYQQNADNLEKCWLRLCEARSGNPPITQERVNIKNEERLEQLKVEMRLQELVYHEAQKKHVDMKETFDREVRDLYKTIHLRETQRVNALKKSLLEFTKTLSNTAPAYLESMQRITHTASQIDCDSYIDSFVDQHQSLMTHAAVPELVHCSIASTMKDKNGASHPPSNISTAPPTSSSEELHSSSATTPPSEELHSSSATTPSSEELHSSSATTPSSEESGQEVKGHVHNKSTSSSFNSKSDFFSKPLKPKKPKKPAIDEPPPPPPSLVNRTVAKNSTHQVVVPTVKPLRRETYPSATGGVQRRQPNPRQPSTQGPHPRHLSTQLPHPRQPSTQGPHPRQPSAQGPPPRQPSTQPGPSPRQPCTQGPHPRHLSTQGPSPRQPSTQPEPSPRQGPRQPGGGGSHNYSVFEEENRLFSKLMGNVEANDYYKLLGVLPEASADELAKARRDKSRLLHPDHFANNEEEKARAQEQLTLINQIFQNVLKNEKSRELYDKLCTFRLRFPLIMDQKRRGLEKAKVKLTDLRQALKKVQTPLVLLEELDSALYLIEIRMNKMETE